MTDTTGDQGATDDDKQERKHLRRRVADRWDSLHVAGKVVVIGGVVLAVVGGLIVLANTRTSADDPEQDDSDYTGSGIDNGNATPELGHQYVGHGVFVYAKCSHGVCTKKMEPRITGHDCCGRCQTSRIKDCWENARRDYDGPGGFAHDYFEAALFPGVCADCGEPPEGHWVLDGAATRLL